MGVMMLGGSLGLLDHSLCPNGVAISVKVTAYPALRSPSLFDCFVYLFGQVLQEMYADNMVFHKSLSPPFATFYPHSRPIVTRCARTDSDGWGVPSPPLPPLYRR